MAVSPEAAGALLRRFHDAMNRHDLDVFATCFAPDYATTQPMHPIRAFAGGEKVRQNWAMMFAEIPDFHATLLRFTFADDALWCEWDWRGTRADGTPYHTASMAIFGIRGDQFAWGRVYMEPVEEIPPGAEIGSVHWTG